jgi:uncharacterized protein involved in outer membrane biogenesis
MRRTLVIAASLLGLLILVLGGLLAYAVLNLNSIIAGRRDYLLSRVSDAVGRPVTVLTIKASLGWGVLIDLNTVQVADDPAFSQLPLVQAQDVYLKVEFLPLLFHEVRITELNVTHPTVHVVRNRDGHLNLAALAHNRVNHLAQLPNGPSSPPNNPSGAIPNGNPLANAPASRRNPIEAISIHRFELTDGVVDYLDESIPNASPVEFHDLEVTVANFSVGSRFDVDLSLAAFGDQRNFDLNGKIGPLITADGLDLNAIPLDLSAKAGPLTLAQLQSIPTVGHALPPLLAITGPLSATATANGTVDAINFTANTDLTANQVIWQPSFTKPAGTAMTVVANGNRQDDRLALTSVNLTLASVTAAMTHITLAPGHLSAHIATNDFAIAPVAALLSAATKYHPTGTAMMRSALAINSGQHPTLDGTVTLSGLALTIPEAKGGSASITQLNGPVRLNGNSAKIGPLTFNLGSAHARLDASAQSLQPPRLSYQFNADKVMLAELIPSRQNLGQDHGPEYLLNLSANGSAASDPRSATLNLTATGGIVANVPFTNLALAAVSNADHVTINSLTLNSCDGSVSANGVATLGDVPSFDLSLATRGLDLQKALTAVKAKAADTVRGQLTGNLQITGHGKDFDRIRPTLRGNGKAQVVNAKLVGVNVAAQALRKIDNLPAIGSLVPGRVVANHPELFRSPDTDIQTASLTFTINGARLSTNDFFAQAIDYSATASGWFDLDKYLDMNAQIILSQAFSQELVDARKNVVFLAGRDGQIIIPLRITGRLPKPQVLPNIDLLAQRAASHAVENKLGGLLDKGGKGLGGLFHGKNPLQGFFH